MSSPPRLTDEQKPLHWRHNDHDGVSNYQPYDCLRIRFFRHRSKKTSKLRVTGLCVGNSPGPVNSPHKGPVSRKMFPFDDVIMHIGKVHRRQPIIWTNAGTMLTVHLGVNFREIEITIWQFLHKKMNLNMSSRERWPFYLVLNMLKISHWVLSRLVYSQNIIHQFELFKFEFKFLKT